MGFGYFPPSLRSGRRNRAPSRRRSAERPTKSIAVANAICSRHTRDSSAVPILEHPHHSRHRFLPVLEDVGVAEPQHAVTRSDDAIRANSIGGRLVPLVAIQLDNEPSINDKVDSVNPDLHLLHNPKAECVKPHSGDCFQAGPGEKCQVLREPMQAFREALAVAHIIQGDRKSVV